MIYQLSEIIDKFNLTYYFGFGQKWIDQTPLSILDQNIKEDYIKSEVIKCIQIGLLCVQHDTYTYSNAVPQESSSTPNSYASINEMPIF